MPFTTVRLPLAGLDQLEHLLGHEPLFSHALLGGTDVAVPVGILAPEIPTRADVREKRLIRRDMLRAVSLCANLKLEAIVVGKVAVERPAAM